MKNIYTYFLSLDNFNQNENFIIDFDEIEDKNNEDNIFLQKLLRKTIIQPKDELINNIMELVRKGVI